MTLLRDQAKEEIESHSRELDEAKQQHAEAQQGAQQRAAEGGAGRSR